jgi:hypothetical protein
MKIQLTLNQGELNAILVKALNERHGTSGKWAIDYEVSKSGELEVRTSHYSVEDDDDGQL